MVFLAPTYSMHSSMNGPRSDASLTTRGCYCKNGWASLRSVGSSAVRRALFFGNAVGDKRLLLILTASAQGWFWVFALAASDASSFMIIPESYPIFFLRFRIITPVLRLTSRATI